MRRHGDPGLGCEPLSRGPHEVASRSKPAQVPTELALLSAPGALDGSPAPAREPTAGRWF